MVVVRGEDGGDDDDGGLLVAVVGLEVTRWWWCGGEGGDEMMGVEVVPFRWICGGGGFKEGKLTRPYSSKGKKMSSMGELTFFLGLQVQQKKDGIFISQDKYVVEILKKFRFTKIKTTSTPKETQKPLLKDKDGEEVDVHMYRSMIGSLMHLTSSRHNIMFAVSYTDSDYAGASLDRKSTTGGCQFLGCRLISWKCKKQTVVANSITETEYVAASSCCGQVLWIHNQLLDYGEVQLHALVDGKKLIISESYVRRDLQLEDAEGIDCLPNSTIFEQLALMGYEKIS
ncbi:uncharacterized mitochondrial protein-like protein [Tanacetum coccineum]